MGDGVRVSSVEALRDFHEFWAALGPEVAEAICAARRDGERAAEEIEDAVSAARYKVEACREGVARAWDELDGCQEESESPGECDGVEAELAEARRELDEAEYRLADLRRAAGRLDDATEAYRAVARGMEEFLDEEFAAGRVTLETKLEDLRRYLEICPPEGERQAPQELP